ncbi:hypothetical protein ABT215_42410 [Streptomyces sp900105755]|uniref:hypothetical protein n=1 Tax=Streptomyces sp. 900105755 TaxID=3154389 RepID=UPI003320AE8B
MMTTDHTNPAQCDIGQLFLEGRGWGFGGSVDIEPTNPWNAAGRYCWVGGTRTAAYVIPATGAVTILLTQVAAMGPVPAPVIREFWWYAADA